MPITKQSKRSTIFKFRQYNKS